MADAIPASTAVLTSSSSVMSGATKPTAGHVTCLLIGPMDDDLMEMSREQLIAEVRRLRNGIREHRDSSGQDLCWFHPQLWSLLPEKTDPLPEVPPWPEFLRGCVKYRQSLDPESPREGKATVP